MLIYNKADGYLARILQPADRQGITVGTPIAVIAQTFQEALNFRSSNEITNGTSPATVKRFIMLPQFFPDGVVYGEGYTIKTWTVKRGERVKAGDVIAEIETEKVAIPWKIQEDGYIAQFLAAEGDTLKQEAPVVILANTKEDALQHVDIKNTEALLKRFKVDPTPPPKTSSRQKRDDSASQRGGGGGGGCTIL